MRTMHLFAGAGGGLLADLILGHEPVCAVEWDAYRCAQLRQRCADGWFPSLHIWEGDIRAFAGNGWRGKVDILHAGIPCPRWSTARRGSGEPTDYWPQVARITYEVRPRFLFLESVPGIQREHQRFEDDLFAIGYTLKPAVITDAASLGAPHSRRRYWALAYSDAQGESMRAINDEMAILSPTENCGAWETNPPPFTSG